MKACLQSTNQWPRLRELEGKELDDEVQTYVVAHGSKLCAEMNRARGTHQSDLKKVWCKNWNNNLTDPSQTLLRVARRDPKYLLILPEDTGNKDQDAKNKKQNEDNKENWARFKRLMIHHVPKCLYKSVWTTQDRINHLVSDVAPSAAEAMAILHIMNNEPKWIWQCGVEKVHGQVGKHMEKLWKEGKTKDALSKNEKEPKPLCSDSHCRANRCGGWNVSGKSRFVELKEMIDDAMRQEQRTPPRKLRNGSAKRS